MKSTATTIFESACGKAKAIVDNDMPIGVFHDYLMELKGMMVDRMVTAHKEQEAQAKQQMGCESSCSE